MVRKPWLAGLMLTLAVAACAEREPPPSAGGDTGAAPAAPAGQRTAGVDYRAVLAVPGRTPADIEQDSWRKPAEVLEFFRVQPGMSALDLFAGAGYFTPLLSAVVGPTGRVVAHNNKAYLDGVGDDFVRLFEGPQALPNAERLTAEGNELELEPGSFDFVLLSAVYHDVYFLNEARNWPRIDGPRLLAELFAAMRPGATLGLIDHAAEPGSPAETGGTLHRIDPEIVKRDFAAAGFVLDAESDVLRNPADDLTKGVFDPAVRFKTDRFVLRFQRP